MYISMCYGIPGIILQWMYQRMIAWFVSTTKWWKNKGTHYKSSTHACPRYYVYGKNSKESSIRIKRSQNVTKFKRMSSSTRTMCLVSMYGLSNDHAWLGIDTFSTFCMTNHKEDFTETPTTVHKKITGIYTWNRINGYHLLKGTRYILRDGR